MKLIRRLLITRILLLLPIRGFSQENNSARVLSMQDAFELAAKNSAQLKLSEINTAFASQKVEIAKLGKLPEISSGLNYGYLSNSQAWDPSFAKQTTVPFRITLHHFCSKPRRLFFEVAKYQTM